MIKVWTVYTAVWLNVSDFNLCIPSKYCDAIIPNEDVEPRVKVFHKRVEFVGSNTNISILLWNITFEDEGEYVCFAKSPKEKNRNHSAVFTLIVVDQSKWCRLSLIHELEFNRQQQWWESIIFALRHIE